MPLSCNSSQPRAIARSRPAVLGRRATLPIQKRPVDLLDMDAAVLHGLGCVGDLDEFAGGFFGVGIGSIGGEFHAHALTYTAHPARTRFATSFVSAGIARQFLGGGNVDPKSNGAAGTSRRHYLLPGDRLAVRTLP